MSVAAYPPGGSIERRLFMGALTVAQSDEMATAAVSTFAGGLVSAMTILGYGRATARLFVAVTAEGDRGSALGLGTSLIGETFLGVTRFPPTNVTASARVMVHAGDLVLVSCGLQVIAGCAGIVCAATANVALSNTTLLFL